MDDDLEGLGVVLDTQRDATLDLAPEVKEEVARRELFEGRGLAPHDLNRGHGADDEAGERGLLHGLWIRKDETPNAGCERTWGVGGGERGRETQTQRDKGREDSRKRGREKGQEMPTSKHTRTHARHTTGLNSEEHSSERTKAARSRLRVSKVAFDEGQQRVRQLCRLAWCHTLVACSPAPG